VTLLVNNDAVEAVEFGKDTKGAIAFSSDAVCTVSSVVCVSVRALFSHLSVHAGVLSSATWVKQRVSPCDDHTDRVFHAVRSML